MRASSHMATLTRCRVRLATNVDSNAQAAVKVMPNDKISFEEARKEVCNLKLIRGSRRALGR